MKPGKRRRRLPPYHPLIAHTRRRVKKKATREKSIGINIVDEEEELEGPQLVQRGRKEDSQGEANTKRRVDIVNTKSEEEIEKEKEAFKIMMREKKKESKKASLEKKEKETSQKKSLMKVKKHKQ